MKCFVLTRFFSVVILSTFVFPERSMASKEATLKLQLIQQILEDALFGDSPMYEFISEMGDQIERLEQGQHLLKSQLHIMQKSLRGLQAENQIYRNALLSAGIINGSCSCDVDDRLLRDVVKQCERHGITSGMDDNNEIQHLKLLLEKMNSTCQQDGKQAMLTSTTTTPLTTYRLGGSTGRNRLIITPLLKSIDQFVQLDINSNTLSKYHLGLRYVSAVCFVEKLRTVLIAQNHPRILSTGLDSNRRNTILKGVWARGMAVDEDRELVFMSIWGAKHGISRMSTTGTDHTVLRNLTTAYMYPLGIAVNNKQMELYVSAYNTVFVLDFYGKILRNLASGSFLYCGIAFDNVGEILYFNKNEVLMKVSLSEDVVSEVLTLPIKPLTLSYYNDTVYYGGVNATGYVGAVQLGPNVTTELQTLSWEYDRKLIICLVP